MSKLSLKHNGYYLSTDEHYIMNVYGYKCVLCKFDTLNEIEIITDTSVNAVNYFNQKYGIKLIKY